MLRQLSFADIYEQYSDKVYSYIFLLVRNKETAEDLTQETFYKAYKKWDEFQWNSKPDTWLIQIGRNLTYDYFRRKKLSQLFTKEKIELANYETPQEILVKGEEVKQLYEAIHSLKIEYKDVLILRKIKEFSIVETAEILGWNEVKVKNATKRAMDALKKVWDRRGGEVNDERFTKV
ncbi:RNA polymerase sigma factor [Bacillus kwashiorkori]|uniref:RNA polymerase sigma factor n=1 Tax=Bacillus kwashiorkori TaxID=1522318 RepID=UPI003B8342B9